MTMLPDWNTALTFVAGVVATLATTIASRPQQQKHAKEGEATLSEATMKWAKDLRDEMDRMRKEYRDEIRDLEAEYGGQLRDLNHRIASLEIENSLFRRHNALLTGQLVGAGLTPVEAPEYPPPDVG